MSGFPFPLPLPLPVEIRPVRNIIGINPAGSSPGSGQINPNGQIGDTGVSVNTATTKIVADAVIRELHEDELEVTEQPVEAGAAITDHAYKLPSSLELEYGWARASKQNVQLDPSFLKALYDQVLGLQVNRILCTVNTGKRIYTNMLVRRIVTESDKEQENILWLKLLMKEVLVVPKTVAVPLTDQAVQGLPQQTAATIPQGDHNLQPATNFNATTVP